VALAAALEEVRSGLESAGAAFGRFERIAVGDKRLLILLIKNPAGANEAVRTLVAGGEPRLAVVALNDATADGKDVSWIWDGDFEPLLDRLEHVRTSGDRAAARALRLRSAGADRSAIEVVPELGEPLQPGPARTPARRGGRRQGRADRGRRPRPPVRRRGPGPRAAAGRARPGRQGRAAPGGRRGRRRCARGLRGLSALRARVPRLPRRGHARS